MWDLDFHRPVETELSLFPQGKHFLQFGMVLNVSPAWPGDTRLFADLVTVRDQ